MYNESGIIDATLRTVSEYMKKTFGNRDGYDYEVIFSDDGSTDGCRAKVESFGDDHIRTVGYEKNRGKGCAIRTGVLAAEGNIVIFTDCDLAYGLDVVAEAVERFEKDPEADIIIGSRNLSKDGYEGYTLLREDRVEDVYKVPRARGGVQAQRLAVRLQVLQTGDREKDIQHL